MKWHWNRTMLNLCSIVAAILKMVTGRNFSMSGINSGHHYLPTYQILISDNVDFLRYCGGHFENVLAHFQRTCSQIYFRFSSYLLRKPHLFVILTVIGWFIVNIQSDLFWHRCLERQAFGTPRMYTLSPSKSIKGSNYREFLKDKNVLLCTQLYRYAPNLESLLTQQYVCVMCTLWSDNTCVFTRFHSVKNANTQLIWSSDCIFSTYTKKNSFYSKS
jgi:hypothetical protein